MVIDTSYDLTHDDYEIIPNPAILIIIDELKVLL